MQAPSIQGDNRDVFESMPVPRALATLAIPTIISQLITLVYNLADAYFVGLTRNAYMIAAVSLVYPVFSMTVALSNLLGVGGGNLISRLLGEHKEQEARKVCVFSLYGAACVSVLFSLGVWAPLPNLLRMLGASADTMTYARQYMMLVVVAGTLPTVLSNTMGTLLRSAGYARQASFGLSMGAILNIVLDPLFMFVLLPEGDEVIGAALATLLSNTVAAWYFFITLAGKQHESCLCLSPRIGFPNRTMIGRVLYIGMPSALTTLLYDLTNVCLDACMAAHGDHQLAALGIVLKAERLPLNTCVGLCLGMMPLVAYNDSAGNQERMRALIGATRVTGLVITAVSILFYEFCSGWIIQLFLGSSSQNGEGVAETLAYGIIFLRCRCVASPFAFLNFHTTYTLQALGDGRTTLMISVLRQCVFYLPILFLMNQFAGELGLVWTQTIAELAAFTVAYTLFRRALRRRQEPAISLEQDTRG